VKFSYYPGCTVHSTAIEYAKSIEAVLDVLGIELAEIEDWNCCGAAAAHSIHRKLGLTLPARNISQAQKQVSLSPDLVTSCPGCFNALKRADYALKNDEDVRKEIEETVGFSYSGEVRIRSLMEVLTHEVGTEALTAKVKKSLNKLKLVCYYGCALVRPNAVTGLENPENPVMMDNLMKWMGADVRDWSYKTECCGADLALTHGDLVEKIVGRLMDHAREAGAEAVVTSCGLCQANLDMRQTGPDPLPVFYFTELMGVAMDAPNRKGWWSKHIINPGPLLGRLGYE
jgi:heterodisulfide reductase subunit B